MKEEVKSIMNRLAVEKLMPSRRQTLPVLGKSRPRTSSTSHRQPLQVQHRASECSTQNSSYRRASTAAGGGFRKVFKHRPRRPNTNQKPDVLSKPNEDENTLSHEHVELQVGNSDNSYRVHVIDEASGDKDVSESVQPVATYKSIQRPHLFVKHSNYSYGSDIDDSCLDSDNDENDGESLILMTSNSVKGKNFTEFCNKRKQNQCSNTKTTDEKKQENTTNNTTTANPKSNQSILQKMQFPFLDSQQRTVPSKSSTRQASPRSSICQLEEEISDIENLFERVQEAMLRGNIRNRILVYSKAQHERQRVADQKLLPSINV